MCRTESAATTREVEDRDAITSGSKEDVVNGGAPPCHDRRVSRRGFLGRRVAIVATTFVVVATIALHFRSDSVNWRVTGEETVQHTPLEVRSPRFRVPSVVTSLSLLPSRDTCHPCSLAQSPRRGHAAVRNECFFQLAIAPSHTSRV